VLLHEAIDTLLAARPGMTSRELADGINRRNLYQCGDGQPIQPKQVSGRVANKTYRDSYRKEDGRISPSDSGWRGRRSRLPLFHALQLPNACPQ
jgi:hypothetical protein